MAIFANHQPKPPLLVPMIVKQQYIKYKHFCIKETQIKAKEISKSNHM
jgi:hypothetical protein